MQTPKLTLLLALIFTVNAHGLIAPWYQYFNLVQSTLASDPCIKADPLVESRAGYLLNLKVCEQGKAEALKAFVLVNSPQRVEITIEGPSGIVSKAADFSTSEQLRGLLNKAFKGNPYFVEAALTQHEHPHIWLEFSKSVVQYFNDNLNDRYGSNSQVAQHAFDQVLDLKHLKSFTVFTTTKRD